MYSSWVLAQAFQVFYFCFNDVSSKVSFLTKRRKLKIKLLGKEKLTWYHIQGTWWACCHSCSPNRWGHRQDTAKPNKKMRIELCQTKPNMSSLSEISILPKKNELRTLTNQTKMRIERCQTKLRMSIPVSMLPNKSRLIKVPNQTKMKIEQCQTKPDMSSLSACF